MITVSASAMTAYEKRTGFYGLGSFLEKRGVVAICDHQMPSPKITYNTESLLRENKSFVDEGCNCEA